MPYAPPARTATVLAALLLAMLLLGASTAAVGSETTLIVTMPSQMLSTHTLTLKAELVNGVGQTDWRTWTTLGSVSVRRVSDGSDVPISVVVFESLDEGVGAGGPPPDSIRLYNGMGSISFSLDDPGAVAGQSIEVQIEVAGLAASKVVEVLDPTTPGLFKTVSGNLTTADQLHWTPEDGIIHMTSDVSVVNGRTLAIAAGTLIMVEPGPLGDGNVLLVTEASVEALGTADDPIYFFPATGPPGMTLPVTTVDNPDSWRGIWHVGDGLSTYRHVFFTGAGNGPVSGHLRPSVLRFGTTSSGLFEDCVFADAPGKIFKHVGRGTVIIRRSLFSRNGIGGEFTNHNLTLLIEDTWFQRIGRSPDPLPGGGNGFDGDMVHLDHSDDETVRRCVFADVGDDAIDHVGGHPTIEDSIIWDVGDKAISLTGGGITLDNLLVLANDVALRGGGDGEPSDLVIRNSTLIATESGIVNDPAGTVSIEESVLARPFFTGGCAANIHYTLGGDEDHLPCGTDNLAAIDPGFVNPAAYDYRLSGDSPGWNAGPTGGRIGWLGFPGPQQFCAVDADCDDGSECTLETCDAGACQAALLDADGDGAPLCAGDCDDTDPAVHPEALELCDSVDNDCNLAVDDAALPGRANSMALDAGPVVTSLSWPAVAGATGYDVVRGSLQALRETGGDFAGAPVTCLADDLAATVFDDSEPLPEGGAYYLIRAANCGGAGSFDVPGVAAPGQRDLGLAGAAGTCP